MANRYGSVRTIKHHTRPNLDYQKKQHYIDHEIDKDVKYFKSMSRGYAAIEKKTCSHSKKDKPDLKDKLEKKKLRHKKKRQFVVESLKCRIEENEVVLKNHAT